VSKFIAAMAIIAAWVALGVATMVYGYGVEVKSWWWVLGIGFFGKVGLQAVLDAIKDE
jgi:ABC-type transport system involved in multi-copper enzyme maturation permease subunit